MDFRLPALGEGIESATVTSVLVKPGDVVKAGQNVIGVETDKAAMEIEADVAGVVESVAVKPGDKIPIGGVVLMLSGESSKPQTSTSPAPAAASPPAPVEKPSKPSPTPTMPVGSTGKSEFKLPALGEGIESATVTAVLVKTGDVIKAGQNVVGVETDKAAMEIEADVAGTVDEVRVKPGDKIAIGAVVFVLSASTAAKPAAKVESAASAPPTVASSPAAKPQPAAPATNGTRTLVPAGPATRRLARELGVSLVEVKGTARGSRVTLDDIKSFVRTRLDQSRAGLAPSVGISGKTVADSYATPALPDFAKYGEIERKPVSKIRETIAKNLTVAWRTMPMVTQNDLADITDLEAGRKRVGENLPKGAPKITWTVLAVKACVAALKEFPNFNASYDMNAGELVLKKFYHIGIAVDTERGLVVPVIKDADKKTIRDIAIEVQTLAEKARTGKLGIDEMRGGSFTIANLGGIGGTSFTPIVNYPEVAILGMCRSSLQPVVRDNQVVPRLMLPLSLTYDHRVIDGADGARFTSRLVQLFSDPMRLLMES